MKILYIITKSEYGGAQTHVSQLAQYMAEKGHSVGVMSHLEGEKRKEIKNSKFQIPNKFKIQNSKQKRNEIKFYSNPYFKNSYNPVLGLKAMAEIGRAVDDFNPDIVHCHSTVAGFWARLCIKNRIPTIFTAHGWAFTEGVSFLRKNLIVWAEKLAAKYCSKIICVSEYDKQLALKYKIVPEGKIITIHNGVEIDKAKSLKRKAQNNNSKCKIVFVGRLAEPKDPILLIKTYNELTEEVKAKSEVLIVGEGEKRKELEKFIKENKLNEKVKLFGSLSREKVFEILRESNIFVLTSNYEGFPITILEAMSCGLPIIASNVGGIREIVVSETGYLVNKLDIEAFKKALTELIENPELRERMGENARKKVEDNFSLEKMLRETEKVYNVIMSPHHNEL